MERQLVPKRVSTTRFALTVEMSRSVAKWVAIVGRILHYGDMSLTGVCVLRLFLLIVGWHKEEWINFLVILGLIVISVTVGVIVTYICFIAIWRGTSGYHQRQDRQIMRGYTQGGWIDLSKEVMFAIWYHMDNGLSIGAFLVLATTNTLSLMFLLQSSNILASLAVCGVTGLLIMFASIAFPITAGHIANHADELEDYARQAKKYWDIQEIQMLGAGEDEIKGPEIAKGLRSGNTITGQWKNAPDDDEEIEIPVDSKLFPDLQPKRRA